MVKLKFYLSIEIRLLNFTDMPLIFAILCTQATLFIILSFPIELITSIVPSHLSTDRAICFLVIL